jgi:hypothetical protein
MRSSESSQHPSNHSAVIQGLGPGIHACLSSSPKAWIPAPSAGMTELVEAVEFTPGWPR